MISFWKVLNVRWFLSTDIVFLQYAADGLSFVCSKLEKDILWIQALFNKVSKNSFVIRNKIYLFN